MWAGKWAGEWAGEWAGVWAGVWAGEAEALNVAAFLAGAAHPRRQKHREMPPPGASAPAFAATAEPASCPPHAKHPKQDTSSTRDERLLEDVQGMCWGCVLKIGCFLHRFLISGPDLRIDARISPFKPSFVHRFLISSPDLRIDAAQSSWR